MDWKYRFLHGIALLVVFVVFGAIYSVLSIFIGVLKSPSLLWIPGLLCLIVIPALLFSLSKESITDYVLIALIFVVMTSVLMLPLMSVMQGIIVDSKGSAPVAVFAHSTFSTNPVTLVDAAVCAPSRDRPLSFGDEDVCLLQKNGAFVGILINAVISFLLLFCSMLIGGYLSKAEYEP